MFPVWYNTKSSGRRRNPATLLLPCAGKEVEGLSAMSQTIELSDESAELLKRQAAAHGLTVDAWVQALAREKARVDDIQQGRERAQAAVARILEIQRRVKPDPEGWTVRNYIDHGRA
jgi:hypothetical protein